MSREYSSGSIKLLFSSPISSLQIILGKYFSMLIYGLIMMGSVLVLVVVAFFSIKDFDLSLVLSGWLGLYLLMATYAAIGLFMSTLTSYQIIAALGTLTFISFLNFIGSLWQHIEGVREVMYWFSLKGRADESIRGLICSEDILYFILVSGMFLGFSVLKLQFAAEADVKLTIEEFILLNMIKMHTDQILQNIAIATGKNKSVVMRMIDSLEQKGLARRTVNPDDRRENLLSITERGAEVLSQYKEIEKRVSAELLSGIPADKIACFFEVADAVSRKARGK